MCQCKPKKYRRFQLLGFQEVSKKDHSSLKRLQRNLPSIMALSSENRSKGTDTVNSTLWACRASAISRLKNALSMRISIFAPGRASRSRPIHSSTKVWAPLEAWTVPQIEDLAGLSNGTEKRVIASGPLLLFVEPHRGSFRPPCGTLHRAVEVQREACELQLAQPFHDKFPHQRSKQKE